MVIFTVHMLGLRGPDLDYGFTEKCFTCRIKPVSLSSFFGNDSVFMLCRTVRFFSLWDHCPQQVMRRIIELIANFA